MDNERILWTYSPCNVLECYFIQAKGRAQSLGLKGRAYGRENSGENIQPGVCQVVLQVDEASHASGGGWRKIIQSGETRTFDRFALLSTVVCQAGRRTTQRWPGPPPVPVWGRSGGMPLHTHRPAVGADAAHGPSRPLCGSPRLNRVVAPPGLPTLGHSFNCFPM